MAARAALTAADWAWLALAVGVIGWDASCPHGQTLSEGVGRYHRRWPWPTRAVVAVLVAHLLDVLPERCDPLHMLTALKSGP